MWHRVQDDVVVESAAALPLDAAALPIGALAAAGWRQGTEWPQPFHDPATETVTMVAVYDKYSGVVAEMWRVQLKDRFVLMGAAMLARREAASQKKLKKEK